MHDHGIPKFQVKGSHPPKTGAQRMRDLRRRNPDYDRQCKARFRARMAAYLAALEAEKAAVFAEMLARHTARTTLMLPAPQVRLALPAPVIDPMLAEVNLLAVKLASLRVQEPVAA
jgi:hypothetical protein